MKALIHIGPPKTGSTTIQAFLRRNRATLAENGVASLAHADWVRTISNAFKSEPPTSHWAHAKGLQQPDRFAAFKYQARRELASELADRQDNTKLVVMSAEGLFSREREQLIELKEFFDHHCNETEFIAYLRRQDFLALSKYKNKVRNERSTSFDLSAYLKQMDYWAHLEKWVEVFGKESLCLRVFPDSAANSFDLVEAFKSEISDRVGGLAGTFTTPANRNIGWNWSATEFVRVANRVSADHIDDTEFHQRLVRLVDSLYSGGAKPTLSQSRARAIVQHYEESNERVRSELRPDLDTLFHSDFSRYPDDESAQQLSVDDSVRMAIELLREWPTELNKRPGGRKENRHNDTRQSDTVTGSSGMKAVGHSVRKALKKIRLRI